MLHLETHTRSVWKLNNFLTNFLTNLVTVLIIQNLILLINDSVQAQIIPDDTLKSETTTVTSSEIRDVISGGAIRGDNLFHSFQEFQIEAGKEAYFANPTGINNIIGRVTGENISQILGTLGVLGTANLYLINPRGIIFGRDARLDIQGNFLVTTAESIIFDQNFEFSATNPQSPPLLTITVPIGLQMGTNPGKIINQSQAKNSSLFTFTNFPIPNSDIVGLQIPFGKTLTLVGGEIIFDNGYITADAGNVFLGSIKNQSRSNSQPHQQRVTFTTTPQGIQPNYGQIQEFGHIIIANNSLLNTSGVGGGNIQIQAGNFTLDNSRFYALTLGNQDGKNIDITAQNILLKSGAQISTMTQGFGRGGDIFLNAQDTIQIKGIGFLSYQTALREYLTTGTLNLFDQNIVLITGTNSIGNAGKIDLKSTNFHMGEGAVILSGTSAGGNGGNLKIDAKNIEMTGVGINSGSYFGSTGQGGDIQIHTDRIILRDGTAIGSETRSDKPSGKIMIQATESVEMSNSLPEVVIGTIIVSSTSGGTGGAGDIEIGTKRLRVAEGASINSDSGATIAPGRYITTGGLGGNITIHATESVEVTGVSGLVLGGFRFPSVLATQTLTANKGGDIRIFTPVLTIREGGRISAASVFGVGDAGDIQIEAQQIQVTGNGLNGEFLSRIDASVGTLSTGATIIGNGGSLNLNSDELIIRDRATISVKNAGSGNGGNINIASQKILLDDQAKIDATTGAGQGGNIHLRGENLWLRRASTIQTDASNANGGDIDINSHLIVAFPDENSDITASAIAGNGGKIDITTQGVFGFQIAEKSTLNSDITASSEFGVNGVVTVNTFNTEPNLVDELPTDLVDVSSQIAQTCSNQAQKNNFSLTGRGGIRPIPKEALNQGSGWLDWRFSSQNDTNFAHSQKVILNQNQSQQPPALLEANQLVIDASGQAKLVANLINFHGAFTDTRPNCRK